MAVNEVAVAARRRPRGSEWRKWDLHLHAPGTKINDCYRKSGGDPDWQQFCQIIHESDVAVVAVADYFSLDGYFTAVEKYQEAYPGDDKLFLPNLELRLPEVINDDGQSVNLHLVFRPTLTRELASKFLMFLTTETTTGKSKKQVACAELKSRDEFESATVSRASIDKAIEHTFGRHAIRQDHVLVVTSAKGDGIRPGGKGSKKRKALLCDEIDKYSDAFYAGASSRDYFLDPTRLEADEPVAPKPIYGGCDAHTFDALRAGLGKHRSAEGASQDVLWIKADPSYEGLLQTLIEPADRVVLQAIEPDQKEPYKVISKVKFSGTDDFPSEVVFNRNLNAIIGSRSSGKSALLAFIAHAVDPAGTVQAQVDASKLKESEIGPAAGKAWADVADITCEVEWESSGAIAGRVIYIPQNSLYEISEHPDIITQKIAPALFRTYPTVRLATERAKSKLTAANEDIKTAVDQWFSLAERILSLTQVIRDLGDRSAIESERDRLQREIDQITAATQLTEEEVAKYQEIAGQLQSKRTRLEESAGELEQLSPYVLMAEDASEATVQPDSVHVAVQVRPTATEIPEAIATRLDELKVEASRSLTAKVEDALIEAVQAVTIERTFLLGEIQALEEGNALLIAKHETNEEFSLAIENHKKQVNTLRDIAKHEKSRDKLFKSQGTAIDRITKAVSERVDALTGLEGTFSEEPRRLDGLTFGVEAAVPTEMMQQVSKGFNQNRISDYIMRSGEPVNYEKAQAQPGDFLTALQDGRIVLNKGYRTKDVASHVLAANEEVRFTAELDDDRIGGFSRSSMTPGKQALFALTLILNESQEPWPLLIDQPEDDLDSRSIYDTIVPYLLERKRERQIIMASHNANLVIGADSEEVIVANRHGVDRPNKGARTFEYLSGSLEDSQYRNEKSPTTLGRFGIREHACEILDGGEEAFQKRRDKYKI